MACNTPLQVALFWHSFFASSSDENTLSSLGMQIVLWLYFLKSYSRKIKNLEWFIRRSQIKYLESFYWSNPRVPGFLQDTNWGSSLVLFFSYWQTPFFHHVHVSVSFVSDHSYTSQSSSFKHLTAQSRLDPCVLV